MSSVRPPAAERTGNPGWTRDGTRATTIGILIVDDDPVVAEVLAACCDEPDMRVLAAVDNGDDALMAADSMAPDVALIDRRLPGRSGVELAREMLRTTPGLKVVIVTADPSPEVEQAAVEAGCAACIGKTMDIGERLPALIRRLHDGGAGPDGFSRAVVPHPRN